MIYQCYYKNGRPSAWESDLKLIACSSNISEATVEARGTYFHILVGRHKYGYFVCIPNHSVGCELSSPDDFFWNIEMLSRFLRKVDAISVAYALPHIFKDI